jgi:hypothetical protein
MLEKNPNNRICLNDIFYEEWMVKNYKIIGINP